jgi:putative nucleotidyltransferase with HDIG domain
VNETGEFRFVAQLGKDLSDGVVSLPSLPDVVIQIRSLLEQEQCDFERVTEVVRVDPGLVSRLMAFANSAYHSRGGEPVRSLEVAIGRLGFEVIRNAALSLAVKQLFLSEQHHAIAHHLKEIWSRSIQLASMSLVIAKRYGGLNEETAFMCGLLHEIGKLYILTRSKDFPEFLSDKASLAIVLDEWHSQIGESIVEVWGFDEEVCRSVVAHEHLDHHATKAPTMVDVVYVARLLVDNGDDAAIDCSSIASCIKLQVTNESIPEVLALYEDKQRSVRQSLSQAA